MKDFYSVLEIKYPSTKEEIRNAYKRLAKKYHPDLNGGESWAEEKFKEIQEAYSTLSDFLEKQEYDKIYVIFFSARIEKKTKTTGNSESSRTTQTSPPAQSASPKATTVRGDSRKSQGAQQKTQTRAATHSTAATKTVNPKQVLKSAKDILHSIFAVSFVLFMAYCVISLIHSYIVDGDKYWIDAVNVTHKKECREYNKGAGHFSPFPTKKHCPCSRCWPGPFAKLFEESLNKNASEKAARYSAFEEGLNESAYEKCSKYLNKGQSQPDEPFSKYINQPDYSSPIKYRGLNSPSSHSRY